MAGELLDAVVSWQTFLVAVLVFGFAPGALLRLIVLAFPQDDPRRRELLAELHAVPRFERPFWVFEQLEVALFEGIWKRAVRVARTRIRKAELYRIVERVPDGRHRLEIYGESSTREELFRIVERMRDGRHRVVVYSDLLLFLPPQSGYDPTENSSQGMIVQIIAGRSTSELLRSAATRLWESVRRSPYRSDFALLGQVAHSLHEIACENYDLESTILARTDGLRRELIDQALMLSYRIPPPNSDSL